MSPNIIPRFFLSFHVQEIGVARDASRQLRARGFEVVEIGFSGGDVRPLAEALSDAGGRFVALLLIIPCSEQVCTVMGKYWKQALRYERMHGADWVFAILGGESLAPLWMPARRVSLGKLRPGEHSFRSFLALMEKRIGHRSP